MTIPSAQQVDLLVKKLQGVAKTDTPGNKSPSNESIPSPSLTRGDNIWAQSDRIPAVASAITNLVQDYTGANSVQSTPDVTSVPINSVYPTWLTGKTNWIPPQFGSTYAVKVYVGSPNAVDITATGTLISASGEGGDNPGEYFFDYQAGLLNFIGETIPNLLSTGSVIYVSGYVYTGLLGLNSLLTSPTLGNINITNTTISSVTSNLVAFAGTAGVVLPAGTSSQYPLTPTIGTTRFNTTLGNLETWNGTTWISSAGNKTVADQQITPDGITATYSLSQTATAQGILVALNGIVQTPNVGYHVLSNNSIQFSQVPSSGDLIDIRYIVGITAGAGSTPSAAIQLISQTVTQAQGISSPTAGQLIFVSNGDAGKPTLAVYDGASWKKIALGGTISAI